MELKDYLRVLRQRGWILLLVALLTAASAYGFSRIQTKTYKASVQIGVNPARADWGLSNTAKDLLRSYVQNYMDTYRMAERVIERAQLDMAPGTFKSHIDISPD